MKKKAVFEVISVLGLTMLIMSLVGYSSIGHWVRQVTNRYFVEYVVMITVPLLLLVITRRNLASYGLSMRNFSYHLDVTATAFVPIAIVGAAHAFVNYMVWSGSLIIAGLNIAVLFSLGWLLKRKPTWNENSLLVGTAILLPFLNLTSNATVANAISAFIFYIFFLGFGEELLFRGYIQTRLNIAFGRPFQFYGVNWGWGIVITSVLFGFIHVLNIGNLASGDWKLEWWWGFCTFFAGLVFGFVREKTGSVIAPAILHGLPQAIAYAVLGL